MSGGRHIETTQQLSLLRQSWTCAYHSASSSFKRSFRGAAIFFRTGRVYLERIPTPTRPEMPAFSIPSHTDRRFKTHTLRLGDPV